MTRTIKRSRDCGRLTGSRAVSAKNIVNEQNDSLNGAGRMRPRRLLLCLDGVPYDLIHRAKERGLFSAFNEPARLLSPFPTMTNIALATMLRASPPLGYECRYFDRTTRDLRGGIEKYIGRRTPDKLPSSYMDLLDYQEPLPFEYLVYVAPEAVWRADMRRFRERFRCAPQTRDYFAFLKGTDGLLHIRGPKPLEGSLESLDRMLEEIRVWCGAETEVILFSDHGMTLQEHRRVNLQTHLRRCGYLITKRLSEGNSRRRVVVPAFGLIGYAALFCASEDDATALADAVVSLEGVDFAIHRDGDAAMMIKGAKGAARVSKAENRCGSLYRYEQIEGDPLQLGPIARALKESGAVNQQGFASDQEWFVHTGDHDYPDALANLYAALYTARVTNTADVLISFKDGYYYGMDAFSRFVRRLVGTHGNAGRASTSAFLMSTHRAFPAVVRGTEVEDLLEIGWRAANTAERILFVTSLCRGAFMEELEAGEGQRAKSKERRTKGSALQA